MKFSEEEKMTLMCAILDKILNIKRHLYQFPNEKDQYEDELKCLNLLQKRMSDNEL